MLIKVRIALMKWAGPGGTRGLAVLAARAALLHPATPVRAFHWGIYEGRAEDRRGRNAAALAREFLRATLWPLALVLLSELPPRLAEALGEV